MTPEQKKLVGYFGGLPDAGGLLNPEEDFHWSRVFSWGRGESFRLSTPIKAAKHGDSWIQNFSRAYGAGVMVPLALLSKGLGFGIRSIKDKRFSTMLFQTPGFYSASPCFEAPFVYGTPIMIVEGVLDAEVASLVYPWVLATLTSKVSEAQVFLLSHLTNTLVMSFDNDEAGEKGLHFSKKHFVKWGLRHFKLQPPRSMKDWGDLLGLPREEVHDELNRVRVELRTKGIIRD